MPKLVASGLSKDEYDHLKESRIVPKVDEFSKQRSPKPEVRKGEDGKGAGEKVTFLGLFRYATPVDCILITVAMLCALATGYAQVLFYFYFYFLL